MSCADRRLTAGTRNRTILWPLPVVDANTLKSPTVPTSPKHGIDLLIAKNYRVTERLV